MLTAVRKEKALAKVSLRVPVTRLVVRDTAARLAKLAVSLDDVREAGNVGEVVTEEAAEPSTGVELAPVGETA